MLSRSFFPSRALTRHYFFKASLVVAAAIYGGMSLRDYVRSAPTRERIETGIRFFEGGQKEAAADQWREATRLDPGNAQAWQLLSDHYASTQKWQAALDALEHLAQADPNTPRLHTRWAEVALEADDIEAAQQHASMAQQQSPDDVQTLQVLADLAQAKRMPLERSKYLQRALDLQPTDTTLLWALAREQMKLKDYPQAHATLTRLLALTPDDATAYTGRATARYHADPSDEELRQAQDDLKKALELNPQDIEARRYMGRIAMRLGRPREAIEYFEKLDDGRPYATAHFLELANAYRKIGQTQQASQLNARFTKLKALNLRAMILKDRTVTAPGDFGSYLQLGALLLSSAESSEDAFHLYCFRYESQKLRECEFYLKKALELRPQNTQAQAAMRSLESAYQSHLQKGLDALKRRDFAEVNRQMAHAFLLRPDDVRSVSALRQVQAASSHSNFHTVLPFLSLSKARITVSAP